VAQFGIAQKHLFRGVILQYVYQSHRDWSLAIHLKSSAQNIQVEIVVKTTVAGSSINFLTRIILGIVGSSRLAFGDKKLGHKIL